MNSRERFQSCAAIKASSADVERIPWKPNPQVWRKFQQAERNMLRLFRCKPYRRGRFNRIRYWAGIMRRLTDKIFSTEPL